MKTIYSEQFKSGCIVIESGDTFEDVKEQCYCDDAVRGEQIDDVSTEDIFVVQFPGRPIEVYTAEALRKSLPL